MTVQSQIVQAIRKYSTIVILRHQRPDPDAYGSQMGLANIIKTTFPDKKIYCGGKQYPSFDWMGKEDKVTDKVYQKALVIVTDTANRPRIDDQRYSKGQKLIKIDHHPDDDQYGDISWVDPKASSASEMIYQLYASSPELKINDEAGRLIYAGIVGDTGRFKYPSTNPSTFEVAAQLSKMHFSTSKVNKKEEEIDLPLAHLCAFLYGHLKMLKSGAAYLVLTKAILEKLKITDENTASIVPLPGNIKGIKAWAIFSEQDDHSYRINLRSNGPTINEVAKDFNGGGHALASGANIKGRSQVKAVVRELDQVAKNYRGELE